MLLMKQQTDSDCDPCLLYTGQRKGVVGETVGILNAGLCALCLATTTRPVQSGEGPFVLWSFAEGRARGFAGTTFSLSRALWRLLILLAALSKALLFIVCLGEKSPIEKPSGGLVRSRNCAYCGNRIERSISSNVRIHMRSF